jgi:CubicO group peptidase (beta-lactamase class C family)
MNERFPTEQLDRLHQVMAGHVEQGKAPGLITLVSRRGETHVDTIGTTTVGGSEPMRRDTIFRITSMTKPITAAATMLLIEEGRLRLDEPVDRLLPELANRRVLRQPDSALDDTVPAHRPITVRDLLTFRMGLGLTVMLPEGTPIRTAVEELQLVGFGPPDQANPLNPAAWLRRLATLPLMFQPGESWGYNTGSYLLGVLIARASGQPLETFLQERLFEPLGMRDTGFSVPPDKLERLVSCYQFDPGAGALQLLDGAADSLWNRPPTFPDGGAGLVSTADDYLAFAQMLMNEGKHGTEQILSPALVELMTTDHLTPEQKANSGFFPGYWDHRGWGFGISTVTRPGDGPDVPARYGWDGGYGTSWYSDPQRETIAILLTQCVGFPLFSPLYRDFWAAIEQITAS